MLQDEDISAISYIFRYLLKTCRVGLLISSWLNKGESVVGLNLET